MCHLVNVLVYILTAFLHCCHRTYHRVCNYINTTGGELLTLPEHLGSPTVFSRICITRSLDLNACFVDRCLSFCPFFGAIVLYVLLRYSDFNYLVLIVKLFIEGRIAPSSNVALK